MTNNTLKDEEFSMDNLIVALKRRKQDSRSNLISVAAANLIYRAQQKRMQERKAKPPPENVKEIKSKMSKMIKKLKKKKHERNAQLISTSSYHTESNKTLKEKRETQKIFGIVTGFLSKNPDISTQELSDMTVNALKKARSIDDLERLKKKVDSVVRMVALDANFSEDESKPPEQIFFSQNNVLLDDIRTSMSASQQPEAMKPSKISISKERLSGMLQNLVKVEKQDEEQKKMKRFNNQLLFLQNEPKKKSEVNSKKSIDRRISFPQQDRADKKPRLSLIHKFRHRLSSKSSNVILKSDFSKESEQPLATIDVPKASTSRSKDNRKFSVCHHVTAAQIPADNGHLFQPKLSKRLLLSLINLSDIVSGYPKPSKTSLKKQNKLELENLKNVSPENHPSLGEILGKKIYSLLFQSDK